MIQSWPETDTLPHELITLRAGSLTAVLDGVDLRYVKFGSREIVRRIYVAIRDQNWNTILGTYNIRNINVTDSAFVIDFDVEHIREDVQFSWSGHIKGSADGTIRYEMDGIAKSDFPYSRIGFCVLHPFKEFKGKAFQTQSPSGSVSGRWPMDIAPQPFEDGHHIALTEPFDKLSCELDDSINVHFDFMGDLFETEDQRNWTDASLKTYCTPLSLPLPHYATAGQRFTQSVTFRVDSTVDEDVKNTNHVLTLGDSLKHGFPSIGFSVALREQPLSSEEINYLGQLRPDHLRVDIHLNSDYRRSLKRAVQDCIAIGCSLEITLFVNDDLKPELSEFASLLDNRLSISRVIVFEEGGRSSDPSEVTAAKWIELVRSQLAGLTGDTPIIGGTDMYFCELNRTRPNVDAFDGVCYSINPQIHAFDDLSIVETLEAQAETVRSAQSFSGNKSIVISPITLKPRYNAVAAVPESEPYAGELPNFVDRRQASLLGAGWTLGSIKYLSEASAHSLTYYETTGWKGVMEDLTGLPSPSPFPSKPGMIYPMYHVFADIADVKHGTLITCESSHPLDVIGLAVEHNQQLHVLVANLSSSEHEVTIRPFATQSVSIRVLDQSRLQEAMLEPNAFRESHEIFSRHDGELVLKLQPYAVIRIDSVE